MALWYPAPKDGVKRASWPSVSRSSSGSHRFACCFARLPAVTCALAVAGGCGDGDLRPDVRYQLVGLLPVSGGACPAASTAPPRIGGATRVRLTFRGEVDRALRCDAVLALDDAAPYVAVPDRTDPVTLYVEYFDDAGTLLARGERRGVDLVGGATVQVHVQPAGAYVCPLGTAGTARAFHSATPLPGGEILLFGGLVGAAGGDSTAFAPAAGGYVSSAAEIYDPRERRFYPLTITGARPRAFHETLVLRSDGGLVELLVVGGLGVAGDPTLAGNIAAQPTAGGAPWTWVDPDGGVRAGSLALPAERLVYDPATRSVTRTEVMGGPLPRLFGTGTLPAGAGAGQALAVVGGKTAGGADELGHESVRGDGTSGGVVNGRPRLGATVVALSPTEALVWGGDLTAVAGSVRAGDRLTMLDGAPALDAGPQLTADLNRAFHAAARLGGGVLVGGGLTVTAGTIQDVGHGVLLEHVDPVSLAATPITVESGTLVAYPAAVAMARGDVLVTGGASPGVCASTLACPSRQSLRVRPGAGAQPPTAASTGSPGFARYGHRLTLLPDGSVLVSGGFTPAVEPDQIRALRDAELFTPHEAIDDPLADLGLGRAPGDVARAGDGTPLAPCTLLGATP